MASKYTLTAADLVVGGLYRARPGKFQENPFNRKYNNDRIIIYMDAAAKNGDPEGLVQYDSYSVSDGRSYPTTKVKSFLNWASHRVMEEEQTNQ